ncbi:hypothetical protein CYMTET_23645 [Cymbomonas tetramitiformis]|uniref:Uncharacterized protein n=1 Tax=Cymbomonas tetramitiformis TaxID=36881 RepID=A0AAE0FXK1_9CHLO|nr:hypothetical protein CYMTET_23645 [Cymbomonas tetramitiformis]
MKSLKSLELFNCRRHKQSVLFFPKQGMEHDGSEKDLPRERQRTLCIGDEVLLSLYLPESRMAGYLEATSDFKSVVAEGLPEEKLIPRDLAQCSFFIYNKFSYNFITELQRRLPGRTTDELLELVQSQSTTGGAVGTGRGMSDKRRAFREKGMVIQYSNQVMEELVANLLELKRLEGAEVLFGDTIQLCHRRSGKFLSFNKSVSSQLDSQCVSIQLVEHGSAATWFSIEPGFKTKVLGQLVNFEDVISFRSVCARWGMLHVSKIPPEVHGKMHGEHFELNCAMDASRFRIHLFALSNAMQTMLCRTEFQMKQGAAVRLSLGAHMMRRAYSKVLDRFGSAEDSLVCSSSVVQINHRESGSTLMCTRTSQGTYKVRFEAEKESSANKLASSNSFWTLECTEPIEGGSLLRQHSIYRIKHVASNMYLVPSLTGSFIEAETSEPENSAKAVPGGAKGKGWLKVLDKLHSTGTVKSLPVSVTSHYEHNATRWRLHPFQDSVKPGPVTSAVSLLYLKNMATGHWLIKYGVCTEINIEDRIFSNSVNRSFAGCTVSKRDHDAFALTFVNDTELNDLWMAKHVSEALSDSLQLLHSAEFSQRPAEPFRSPREDAAAWQAALLASPLGTAISQCSALVINRLQSLHSNLNPAIAGYNQSSDAACRRLQDVLREHGVIELVAGILEELFVNKKLPPLLPESLDSLLLLEMCQMAYAILRQICKGHLQNKRRVSKYTMLMQQHLRTAMKPGNTLMEVYSGNTELLRELSKEWIERFVELVNESDRPDPLCLGFLVVCMVSNGQPISEHQNFIGNLLHANQQILPLVHTAVPDEVVVEYQGSGLRVDLSDISDSKAQTILKPTPEDSSVTVSDQEQLAVYFYNMLMVYKALCTGYNHKLVGFLLGEEVMRRVEGAGYNHKLVGFLLGVASYLPIGVDFHTLLGIMRSTSIPGLFRKAAVEILITLFVDGEMHTKRALHQQVRVWSILQQGDVYTSTALKLERSNSRLEEARNGFPELKEFVVSVLGEAGRLMSYPGNHLFILAVLDMLQKLLELGFYAALEYKGRPLIRCRASRRGSVMDQVKEGLTKSISGINLFGDLPAAPATSPDKIGPSQTSPGTGPSQGAAQGKAAHPRVEKSITVEARGRDELEILVEPLVDMLYQGQRLSASTPNVSAEMQVVLKVKMKVCQILEQMYDIRADRCLSIALAQHDALFQLRKPDIVARARTDSEEQVSSGETPTDTPTAIDRNPTDVSQLILMDFVDNVQSEMKRHSSIKAFDSILPAPSFLQPQEPPLRLVNILKELMLSNHPELARRCFTLLHRAFNDSSMLLKSLQGVRLLALPSEAAMHAMIMSEVADLLQLHLRVDFSETASAASLQNTHACCAIIRRLTGLCTVGTVAATGHRVSLAQAELNQMIIGNEDLSVIKQILSLLQKPCTPNSVMWDPATELCIACHGFLVALCSAPVFNANQLQRERADEGRLVVIQI